MGDTMIMRAPKDRENPYKAINVTMANDERLSWEARGVGFYLLTKPDGWRIYPSDLIKRGLGGKDLIYRILKEFELCGYLERVQQRDERGRLSGQASYFHETPLHFDPIVRPERKRKKAEAPYADCPDTDAPDADQPDADAPHTRIKEPSEAINPQKLNTTTRQPSAQPTPPAASGGAGAPGGGGAVADRGTTPTERYLIACGVKTKAALSRHRDKPLEAVKRTWADCQDRPAKLRPGALIALLDSPAWTAEEPAAAPVPPKAPPPYLDPARVTWTETEYEQRMAAYSAGISYYGGVA